MFYTKEISFDDVIDATNKDDEPTDYNRLMPAALTLEKTFSRFGAISKSIILEPVDGMRVAGGTSWIAPLKRDSEITLRFSALYAAEETINSNSIHLQTMLNIYDIPFAEIAADEPPVDLKRRIEEGRWAYQILGSDIYEMTADITRDGTGRLVSHLSRGGYFRLGSEGRELSREDPVNESDKFKVLVKRVNGYILDRIGIYMPLPLMSASEQLEFLNSVKTNSTNPQ